MSLQIFLNAAGPVVAGIYFIVWVWIEYNFQKAWNVFFSELAKVYRQCGEFQEGATALTMHFHMKNCQQCQQRLHQYQS